MTIAKSDPIIIIGAGAFGLSTALRLSEDGFNDITVLEKDESLPSRFSAANDLNKILRAEYEDPFYTELALVSLGFSLPPRRQIIIANNPCVWVYRRLFVPGRHPSSHLTFTEPAFYTAFQAKHRKEP